MYDLGIFDAGNASSIQRKIHCPKIQVDGAFPGDVLGHLAGLTNTFVQSRLGKGVIILETCGVLEYFDIPLTINDTILKHSPYLRGMTSAFARRRVSLQTRKTEQHPLQTRYLHVNFLSK